MDVGMINKHIQKCSELLVIREMEVKIPKRHYWASTWKARLKRLTILSIGEDVEHLKL